MSDKKSFPFEPDPKRTVKPATPIGMIIGCILGAILLLGGIFFAITSFNQTFVEKRMTGVIVEKQFTSDPQEEVVVGRGGGLHVRSTSGEFTLTVRVAEGEGSSRDFTVWVPEHLFHEVEVGDHFDVGPYLVPSAR